MPVLITVFDPVICKTPANAPLHCLPFCEVKWQAYNFEGMWQILHTSFWKLSKLSNSGISLNWSTSDGRNYNLLYNSLLFWPILYMLK